MTQSAELLKISFFYANKKQVEPLLSFLSRQVCNGNKTHFPSAWASPADFTAQPLSCPLCKNDILALLQSNELIFSLFYSASEFQDLSDKH